MQRKYDRFSPTSTVVYINFIQVVSIAAGAIIGPHCIAAVLGTPTIVYQALIHICDINRWLVCVNYAIVYHSFLTVSLLVILPTYACVTITVNGVAIRAVAGEAAWRFVLTVFITNTVVQSRSALIYICEKKMNQFFHCLSFLCALIRLEWMTMHIHISAHGLLDMQ